MQVWLALKLFAEYPKWELEVNIEKTEYIRMGHLIIKGGQKIKQRHPQISRTAHKDISKRKSTGNHKIERYFQLT